MSAPAQPSRPYVYNHVPDLKQLLPNTAGQPGVEYFQVACANVRRAQDQGWRPTLAASGAPVLVYTIENKETGDSIDCEL